MKKIITLLPALFCATIFYTATQAQCYDDSLSFSDWIEYPCVGTQKTFADSVNALKDGQICTTRIGNVDYMVFQDQLGNRHQLHLGSSEGGVTFTMFKNRTSESLVLGRFDFGTLQLIEGSLEIKKGARYFAEEFQNWDIYMSSFAPKMRSN